MAAENYEHARVTSVSTSHPEASVCIPLFRLPPVVDERTVGSVSVRGGTRRLFSNEMLVRVELTDVDVLSKGEAYQLSDGHFLNRRRFSQPRQLGGSTQGRSKSLDFWWLWPGRPEEPMNNGAQCPALCWISESLWWTRQFSVFAARP